MTTIVTLAAAGAVTWLLRASFIVLGDRATLPPFAERTVAHARPAFLAVLVVGAFLGQAHRSLLAVPAAWLAALAAGVLASRTTGNMLATSLTGMAVVAIVSMAGF